VGTAFIPTIRGSESNRQVPEGGAWRWHREQDGHCGDTTLEEGHVMIAGHRRDGKSMDQVGRCVYISWSYH
jgi:hypothetical protein